MLTNILLYFHFLYSLYIKRSTEKSVLLFSLFQSFFKGLGAERSEVSPMKTVLRCQYKRLGKIVTRNYLALLFRLFQKGSCALGGTGIIHIENTDDG